MTTVNKKQDERVPPARSLTTQQALITGGTLAATGIADIAMHGGLTGIVIGGLLTFVVARHSGDIVEAVRPGQYSDQVLARIDRIVERPGQALPMEQSDQSIGAKLSRLIGLKPAQANQEYTEGLPKNAPVEPGDDDDFVFGDEDEAPVSGLPRAPRFRSMSHLVAGQDENLILCYGIDGPVYGSLKDLLSLAIVGKPGRGKSTAFLYYVALLARTECDIWMIDPHGSLSELASIGLRNFHYTDDRQDIPSCVQALDDELESRRQLYRRTKQVKRPLLLMIDEITAVASYGKKNCPELFDLLEKFVLEARKWNCYVWLAGPSTDADILPTRVRDNLSARLCFYTTDERARMVGIETPTIKALMPSLRDERIKGCMIFDCTRLSQPFIGAIPYLTVEDVRDFLQLDPPDLDEHSSLMDEFYSLTYTGAGNDLDDDLDDDVSTEVNDTRMDARTPKTSLHEPTEQARKQQDTRTSEKKYPLMDALQIELFCTAYSILGNTDKSLSKAGCNTRYRDHARIILAERGLK